MVTVIDNMYSNVRDRNYPRILEIVVVFFFFFYNRSELYFKYYVIWNGFLWHTTLLTGLQAYQLCWFYVTFLCVLLFWGFASLLITCPSPTIILFWLVVLLCQPILINRPIWPPSLWKCFGWAFWKVEPSWFCVHNKHEKSCLPICYGYTIQSLIFNPRKFLKTFLLVFNSLL